MTEKRSSSYSQLRQGADGHSQHSHLQKELLAAAIDSAKKYEIIVFGLRSLAFVE